MMPVYNVNAASTTTYAQKGAEAGAAVPLFTCGPEINTDLSQPGCC